jgi:hypothetical protein
VTPLDHLEVTVRGISHEEIHNLETATFIAPVGAMVDENYIYGDGVEGTVDAVYFPCTGRPTAEQLESLALFAPFNLSFYTINDSLYLKVSAPLAGTAPVREIH